MLAHGTAPTRRTGRRPAHLARSAGVPIPPGGQVENGVEPPPLELPGTWSTCMHVARLLLPGGLGPPFLPSGAAAQDWPRFRGPNGAGVAAALPIPARWAE